MSNVLKYGFLNSVSRISVNHDGPMVGGSISVRLWDISFRRARACGLN